MSSADLPPAAARRVPEHAQLAAAHTWRASAASLAFSTGERPVWDSPIFRDLVLGNSLTGGAAAKKPARAGVKQLSDALGMLTAQLYVLINSSTLAPALKPVVGRVHAAFSRSMDTCRAIPQVSDQASFFEVLSSFVAKVRAMQPGSVLVVPGGWKNGLVCYVLHCESFESFNLAVCSTQDGLQYHQMRIDPATGDLQYNAPLLLRGIPAPRVRGASGACSSARSPSQGRRLLTRLSHGSCCHQRQARGLSLPASPPPAPVARVPTPTPTPTLHPNPHPHPHLHPPTLHPNPHPHPHPTPSPPSPLPTPTPTRTRTRTHTRTHTLSLIPGLALTLTLSLAHGQAARLEPEPSEVAERATARLGHGIEIGWLLEG